MVALAPTAKLLAVSKADPVATSRTQTSNPGNSAGLQLRMLPHGSNVVGITVIATTMAAVMIMVAATTALLLGPKTVVATMATAPKAVTALQVLPVLQALPPALLHGSNNKLLRRHLLEAKEAMAMDILVTRLVLLRVRLLVFQAPLQAWIPCTTVLERLPRLPQATDLLLL